MSKEEALIETRHRELTLHWSRSYIGFLNEAADLIVAHWDEVGSFRQVLQLNPHHAMYQRAESGGNLNILLARWNGSLIGYFFIIASKHARDVSKLMVTDDIIYVKPSYRKYGVGLTLLEEGVNRAKEMGAVIVMFREKARRRKDGVVKRGYLERLGFELHELVYAKVLT